MALKKIFCPDCGRQTQVNEEKEFCFCPECGSKILLQVRASVNADKSMQDDPNTADNNNLADERLKEVEFYYSLSLEKKEYEKPEEEPVYYLKAQDLLVDLSQQYPQDYRIWWELSKPLDFMRASSNTNMPNQCGMNENYFGRALDLAGIEDKKRLIDARDKYVAEKKAVLAFEEKEREKRNRKKEGRCKSNNKEQRRKERKERY